MLMRIAEAARELGLCEEYIRRKIRQGKWPCYKLGAKATRVDLDEIKAWGRKAAEVKKMGGGE